MALNNEMFPGTRRVYLDGDYIEPAEARVSAFDRGFIFGDGIYEVIAAYGGRAFRLGDHLARLSRNLSTVGISNPHDEPGWRAIIGQLLDTGDAEDQYIYIQVTRGVAPRNHAFPEHSVPTVFAYSNALEPVADELLQNGVSVILRPDIRWGRCDIKSTSLIAAAWLRQQAAEVGAEEAVLVRDGMITEGASSNVFIVSAGEVVTPPNGPDLLPGITRGLVLKLLQEHRVPVSERPVSEQELLAADEVWISSTIREVLPVIRVDDHTVADSLPGPLFARCHSWLQECKAGLAGRAMA